MYAFTADITSKYIFVPTFLLLHCSHYWAFQVIYSLLQWTPKEWVQTGDLKVIWEWLEPLNTLPHIADSPRHAGSWQLCWSGPHPSNDASHTGWSPESRPTFVSPVSVCLFSISNHRMPCRSIFFLSLAGKVVWLSLARLPRLRWYSSCPIPGVRTR